MSRPKWKTFFVTYTARLTICASSQEEVEEFLMEHGAEWSETAQRKITSIETDITEEAAE